MNPVQAIASQGRLPARLRVPTVAVKTIIDKTATFVARNGPEFESRILKNEQNNTKFSFLQPNDPYQPYYKARVVELGGAPTPPAAINGDAAVVSQETTAKTQKKAPTVTPLEPSRPNYTVSKPQGAQPQDLDVIQLTAQCAALLDIWCPIYRRACARATAARAPQGDTHTTTRSLSHHNKGRCPCHCDHEDADKAKAHPMLCDPQVCCTQRPFFPDRHRQQRSEEPAGVPR